MKIKHTVYLLLLIFSLIPLYIFGTFMVYENNRKTEDIMQENLTLISESMISSIQSFCEVRKETMEMIAEYDLVLDAVHANLDTSSEYNPYVGYVNNMLLERKKYKTFLESISIVDKNFKIVASSENYQISELSYLKNVPEKYLSGDFFIADAYTRETDNGPQRVVIAYQGIFDQSGLIGYVVEEILTSYFDSYRTNTNLWQHGTLYIIDGNVSFITAGTPGESTAEEQTGSNAAQKVFDEIQQHIDTNHAPSGSFDYSIEKTDYVTYYSNIDYTNWTICLTVDLSPYKESAKAYRALLLTTILCISLLLVTINYFLTKRLTHPVNEISNTLKKIQQEQNYSLRIKNSRNDELSLLSENINELLAYVEKTDIQQQEYQQYLAKKAELDPLTGIYNKKAIEKKIKSMIQPAIDTNTRIAVGFLDIDDFRDYNTMYGHQEGDRVIQFVASVLNETIDGIAGRIGGDEFIFCITAVSSKESIEKMINTVLQKLHTGMENIETGKQISIPCSIGILADIGTHIRYDTLVHGADEAMYTAKNMGKNTYHIIYNS